MFEFCSSLYGLHVNPLSGVEFAKVFSHSGGCLFTMVVVSFAVQNGFDFMGSHFSILGTVASAAVFFRRLLPAPVSWSVSPQFSSSNLNVSDLTWRSLMYFELIFVQSGRSGSSFIFPHVDTPFPQHHLLYRLSHRPPPMCGFFWGRSVLLLSETGSL